MMARNKQKPSENCLDNNQIAQAGKEPLPHFGYSPFQGYVVAIGASAGGLDALERFFDELETDTGAVFVVIQHLSPDHKSMMDNLLGRRTTMPVLVAENGMTMKRDHVYLIPPGKNMTVANAKLRLIPKNPHGLSLPIDLFFTSMAKEFGRHCIGAILSGMGSDGTRGAVAINDAGGFLLAQDPQTAKFDGMPRSVIATGLVDETLAPGELAQRIVSYVKNPLEPRVKVASNKPVEESENAIDTIFHLLYDVCGINFKEYKPATVQRRIERRMQVRHVRDLQNYLHLVESDREELFTLKRDTLIPVTSFFRDPETFQMLEKWVIEPIIQSARERQPIRVWIAGCSTGEEPYTIAILFAEAFDRLKRWPNIKIFATDVEQHYVDFASVGVYPESIVNELSPERLERFFTRNGKQYVVKTEIRQNIVFARHNLLEDPPFTRMDLASCRNTLIYFDTNAQEKALLKLQYSLVQKGYLLLGSSESLGSLQRDFETINAKHKLYQVIRPVTLPLDLKSTQIQLNTRKPSGLLRTNTVLSEEAGFIEEAQSILMKAYVPPAILVNAQRELVHVFGDAQRYLQFPEGQASLEISKLLAGKLASVGVALIHKAQKDNISIHSSAEFIQSATGLVEHLQLSVIPLSGNAGQGRFFVLSFETVSNRGGLLSDSDGVDIAAITNDRIQTLEYDLSMTRDSLQATIEELETSNEELQATNEELMASNEDLQSTNEELQSVNEELYTVNSENQEKIEILYRLNADLDNMARAALIPTIFVDAELMLTRFTAEAGKVFPLREGDIGRPISDFSHSLNYPELLADLRRILDTAQMIEREVQTYDRRWFLARLLPYIDNPHNINGAVITLFETTHIKDAQRLQAIIDSLPQHIAVLDTMGLITLVNKAWRDFAESNGDRGMAHTGPGWNYVDVCKAAGSGSDGEIANAVVDGISRVLSGKLKDFSIQYPCHSPTEQRWFLLYASPINHGNGGVVVSHVNITEWIAEQVQAHEP